MTLVFSSGIMNVKRWQGKEKNSFQMKKGKDSLLRILCAMKISSGTKGKLRYMQMKEHLKNLWPAS